MTVSRKLITATVLATALAGCASEGELVVTDGVGITAIRTACPAVGIPDYTGDVTVFGQAGDKSVGNVDLTASMTNLRSTCGDSGENVYTEATFDVLVRRTDIRGARTVTIPFFTTVLQGGSAVQAKRIGQVTVQFADGQERARASGKAGAFVNRAAATLPADIRERITRKRKPGDADAALDPLADPQVRAALDRATFEMLVGFQLTEDQLRYNVTR